MCGGAVPAGWGQGLQPHLDASEGQEGLVGVSVTVKGVLDQILCKGCVCVWGGMLLNAFEVCVFFKEQNKACGNLFCLDKDFVCEDFGVRRWAAPKQEHSH